MDIRNSADIPPNRKQRVKNMEYNRTKPEKDFANRTIESANESKVHKDNTALQINLLFGTVMLPKSHWYKSLDKFSFGENEISGVNIQYDGGRIE